MNAFTPAIKNISNRDAVNIDNCEKEPIHIPGSIQEHGFLLAVDVSHRSIEFVSENCVAFTGIAPAGFLGKKLDDFFSEEEVTAFYEKLSSKDDDDILPFVFTYHNTQYNTSFHLSGNLIILELEPFPDGRLMLPDLYKQTKRFSAYLNAEGNLQALCQRIAEETKKITGYDRVMIYKFDDHYNGEVYAESKREDLESFMGLHYPHTGTGARVVPPQPYEDDRRCELQSGTDLYVG